MRRRSLIGAIAGSLGATTAGCLEDDTADGPGSSSTLSVVDTDADPGPLAFAVSVLEDSLTPTTVPRVTVGVENAGAEPASWRYGGSRTELPFPQAVATDPLGLTAVVQTSVEEQLEEAGTDEGCAHVPARGRDDAVVEASLEPGGVFEREYAVAGVAADLESPCLPAGVYRFAADYGEYGSWGFSVRLTDPD